MQNILDELSNLNEQQLLSLNAAVVRNLKRVRAAQAKAMKLSLNEGDTVKWRGKKGPQRGTVVAIKRKFAHVDVGNVVWRVPMNMLNKVTEISR